MPISYYMDYDRKDLYELRKFVGEHIRSWENSDLKDIADRIRVKGEKRLKVSDAEMVCLLLEDIVSRWWWDEKGN